MKFDYDVIIIGSGPSGFSCAMQSTKFDKKVLIVEANDLNMGGSWISKGTVPSKALRSAAKLIQSFQSQFGDEKGRKPYEKFRMEDIMKYKSPILESKNRNYVDDIIKNEVHTARGWGRITGKNEVEVVDNLKQKKKYTAEYILISTGSRPAQPKNITIDNKQVLDYSSILELTHIPRRLVIIGGGIISLEYATIFSALGTRVTILNESSEMLPFLDEEIKNHLNSILKSKTIQVVNNMSVDKISYNDLRTNSEVLYRTKDEDRLQVVETDQVLFVGSKVPNTDNIGLEELNIKMADEGTIITDPSYKTSVSNIYAAGDVIGQPALASASFLQGRLASVNMFGNRDDLSDATGDMPYGIYSVPEISGIGLTEKQAIDLGLEVTVGRAYYKSMTRAFLNHETDGMLKLVFRNDNLKLLGVHVIGEQASDMVHVGQTVMAFDGDIKYFIERVLNYPTYAEAYKIAAFNGLNRAHKSGVKYKKLLNKK